MRKACLVVQPPYDQGKIFDITSPLNRDNCLKFFHELKNSFAKNGYDLNTQDINSAASSDIVIYNEMPKSNFNQIDKTKSFILLFESEIIRPDNWDLEKHKSFKALFTWNDKYVDNQRYYKFNFTHFGRSAFISFQQKNKMCALIAGSKSVRHPLELYSERIKTIRWFEQKAPSDFDLYGMGWNLFTFKGSILSKILNRLKWLRKFFAKKWPSYKGPTTDKLQTLKNYKFSICYENAHSIPGYITEKIFDSLSAGCIPVYWGASNIATFVPEKCFINRGLFSSHEDLYLYLKNMGEVEYNERIEAIKKYLTSDLHEWFNPEFIAKKVTQDILKFYENR